MIDCVSVATQGDWIHILLVVSRRRQQATLSSTRRIQARWASDGGSAISSSRELLQSSMEKPTVRRMSGRYARMWWTARWALYATAKTHSSRWRVFLPSGWFPWMISTCVVNHLLCDLSFIIKFSECTARPEAWPFQNALQTMVTFIAKRKP